MIFFLFGRSLRILLTTRELVGFVISHLKKSIMLRYQLLIIPKALAQSLHHNSKPDPPLSPLCLYSITVHSLLFYLNQIFKYITEIKCK